MASSFLNGGLDASLDARSWRKSDPPDTDAAFSFLRQPLPSVPSSSSNHTSRTSISSYGNSNGSSSVENNGGGGGDAPALVHRRFTSSFASPFGYSRRAFEEPPVPDIPAAFKQALSPGDKKKAEYEYLMQKKLDRQKQFEQLTRDRERDELDLKRLQDELGFVSMNGAGPQSEPTTPPEYGDHNGFPTSLSRPNRFSTSNLNSSTAIFGNRRSQTDSSGLASPPSERARAYNALTGGSGPQSKHNSDEEEDDAHDNMLDFNHRSAALVNRNSMPVTRRDHTSRNGLTDSPSLLGHVNTHAFLFGDEEVAEPSGNPTMSEGKPRPISYVHSNTEGGFPVLIRQQTSDLSENSETSSATASKRSSLRRSLPPQSYPQTEEKATTFGAAPHNAGGSGSATPTKSSSSRHSFGTPLAGNGFASNTPNKRPGLIGSPPNGASADSPSVPKLQSSYSTNDIPTVKNTTGAAQASSGATSTAEQRLHQHNASLGRIPASAMSNKRNSRDASGNTDGQVVDDNNIYSVLQSPVNANSASSSSQTSQTSTSGPPMPSYQSILAASQDASAAPSAASTPIGPNNMFPSYNTPGLVGFGGMQPANVQGQMPQGQQNPMSMLNASMNSVSIGSQGAWNQPGGVYNQGFPPQSFNTTAFPTYGGGRFQDVTPRSGPMTRRNHGNSDADASRFTNIPLESLQGEIYTLCKDQHGCRFLQKKLEERNEQHTELIFNETKGYMVELMTDPFGNYLCQKLLEYTSDNQRTALINNAAPHMVKIALNQHGTRALQKMIEYVLTREQIDTLIEALKDHVVAMIQDLNGNHVIQKCLNRLAPEDVQFIISAVSNNCVVVGTHRHGCCVIQRCIDHATGPQKAQLVGSITNCSFPLVQDPFGNYVLQYIFDQNEDSFSQLLCRTFLGQISNLSKQKFSSNVIEKCIRIADTNTRHAMIEEIIHSPEFDRLADDPFANYVVQTAWLHASPEDEVRIADRMRPILPRLRHKPHGRRFQIRLQDTDKRHPGHAPGSSFDMPAEEQQKSHQATGSQESFYQPPDSGYGNGFPHFGQQNNSFNDFSRPSTHRSSNPPLPNLNMTGYQNQQFNQGPTGFGGLGGNVGGNMGGGANPWGANVYGQQPHY